MILWTKKPQDEVAKEEPIELKKVMIFAVPMKTKNGTIVEVLIMELVLHIERKLKFKVERIHTDPGSELKTKSSTARCPDNGIRKTMSIPEEFKVNGTEARNQLSV